MKAKLSILCFLLAGLAYFTNATDSVFWTNDKQLQLQKLDEMIESKSVEHPLVLFLLNQKFDIGDFSRLASVYNGDSVSLIPSLTKWISSSKGYSGEWITENVDDILSEIPQNEILHFKKGDKLDSASLIVVQAESLTAIDSKVEEVLSKMKNRKFRALLTAGKRKIAKKRVKRDETTESSSTATNDSDATYIKGDSCLFYAREVWVTIERKSAEDSKVHVVIDGQGEGSYVCQNITDECMDSDTCNSTFTIEYNGEWTESDITVKSLKLAITLKADSYGYWYLTNITVQKLEIEGKATFSVATDTDTGVNHMGIWSKKKMAYACWQTPTAFIKNHTKSELASETRIGVSFNKFEVQPFMVQDGKFTDNVDDCVGFFTIGTWMGLITALIMVLVFLFGIAMITSLKTMDRFDDPKAKPIQINLKE